MTDKRVTLAFTPSQAVTVTVEPLNTPKPEDVLIAAIEKNVGRLYADHHAGCPAIMRGDCTCEVWRYNSGIIQTMHRVRDEVREYFRGAR